MNSFFRNELNTKFESIIFKDKELSKQEVAENKMFKKINRNNYKYSNKIESDIMAIIELIKELDNYTSLNLISKKFDSPNIIKALKNQIESLYISTFSITPAGISSLLDLTNAGNIKECILLLSSLHTTKWLITSGAYKILKQRVKIKLCPNHSKFICIKTKCGVINFVGSMNFTNNPRFENITIDKNPDNFKFYSDFIKTIDAKIL